MRLVVSCCALSFWSSHGFVSTSFIFGYLSFRRASMCLRHSFMFAAVSVAVMIAKSPSSPQSFAAVSIRTSPMPWAVAWLTKKPRASGCTSLSYVTTLIPFAWAFFRAELSPSRFSAAAAMTFTSWVIQFSTISFCFAASVFVGPSKSNCTPSSAAAIFAPFSTVAKYWLPLLLGKRPTMILSLPLVFPPVLDLLSQAAKNAIEATSSVEMIGFMWFVLEKGAQLSRLRRSVQVWRFPRSWKFRPSVAVNVRGIRE